MSGGAYVYKPTLGASAELMQTAPMRFKDVWDHRLDQAYTRVGKQ